MEVTKQVSEVVANSLGKVTGGAPRFRAGGQRRLGRPTRERGSER